MTLRDGPSGDPSRPRRRLRRALLSMPYKPCLRRQPVEAFTAQTRGLPRPPPQPPWLPIKARRSQAQRGRKRLWLALAPSPARLVPPACLVPLAARAPPVPLFTPRGPLFTPRGPESSTARLFTLQCPSSQPESSTARLGGAPQAPRCVRRCVRRCGARWGDASSVRRCVRRCHHLRRFYHPRHPLRHPRDTNLAPSHARATAGRPRRRLVRRPRLPLRHGS